MTGESDVGFIGAILAGAAGLCTAVAAALHSRGVQKELGLLRGAVETTNTRVDSLEDAATERRLEGRRFEDRVLAELREERRLREVHENEATRLRDARDAETNRLLGTLFEKVESVRLEVAELKPRP